MALFIPSLSLPTQKKAKDENTSFLRGHLSSEVDGNFLFVTLQILPLQKIIVGKISHGGGGGGPSTMVNLRKIYLNLVFLFAI